MIAVAPSTRRPGGRIQKFLLRGNVVDLAVAVVLGTAFAAVVAAFTNAFLTPLVGVVTGAAGDFSQKSFTVAGTRFPYGEFVQALLTFVLTAAVVYFFVVRPVNALLARLQPEPDSPPATKSCPECLSSIPRRAARCAFCTVEQLDSR
jgi:large conductance mechanosensitive channel